MLKDTCRLRERKTLLLEEMAGWPPGHNTRPWTKPHAGSMTMLKAVVSFRDQSCPCFGPEEVANGSRDSASSQAPRIFHSPRPPQGPCTGFSSTGKFLFSLTFPHLFNPYSDLSFNHKEAFLHTHTPAHTHGRSSQRCLSSLLIVPYTPINSFCLPDGTNSTAELSS